MDSDFTAHARAVVRQRFGKDLAEKASDSFCAAQVPGAHLEAFRAPPVATVIEFDRSAHEAERARARELRLADAYARAGDALRTLDASDPEHSWNLETLVRVQATKRLRERVLRQCGGVVSQLEQAATIFRDAVLESGPPVAPITELCWLNGTARTSSSPWAVAEVAGAAEILSVDTPRRLRRELAVTTPVVGAPQYRAANGVSGNGVIVALIDAEVALGHPALDGRVVHRANFTREHWGRPDPHATGIAGIIAGDTGVAPGAMIYNYKVVGANGALYGDDFEGALALQRAVEDGARVANCSWGTGPAGEGTSREAIACNTAWDFGMTVVKSAGNNGPGTSTLTAPGDAAGVVVVGATNRGGTLVEDYSSRGPLPSGADRPDFVAPGGSPDDWVHTALVGGGFGASNYGTSFAAPHVVGLVALLLEQNPRLTPDAIRDELRMRCTTVPGAPLQAQGAGLISFN